MRLSDFDYDLPADRIAQRPIEPRDAARLLVLHESGEVEHRSFRDLPEYLRAGDLLVMNDTRVLAARLHGWKAGSGGRVEVLLLRELGGDRWEALVNPGRRLQVGVVVEFPHDLRAEVVDRTPTGGRIVQFSGPPPLRERVLSAGVMPLPPYIHTALDQPERYQTVYARREGSAAAPTAGLHFTPALLEQIRAMGVETACVTLHIGLDTFRPIKVEDIEQHQMHTEHYTITAEAADAINRARAEERRLVTVGTTTARALESAADDHGRVQARTAGTDLFIRPGYNFRVVRSLVTNFHMPKSSLLVMVSALAGRERVLAAYREALAEGYRFLSFGDAMLVV